MDSSLTIIMPLWVLLAGFVGCLLFWKYPRVQIVIALTTVSSYLLSAVYLLYAVIQAKILVLQIGGWPAPFGITLVADYFAALMVLVSAIIAFVISMYSLHDISAKRKVYGFYPLMIIMVFGVCGSFLTGDIFNLYVWFEVMLVASFILIVLGNGKPQLEGAVKYVILSFISSGFLLTGIGMLYRLTGSLNMADLALAIPDHPNPGLITLASVFFFVGFGIKAAVFPLFSWLPAAYHTPSISVAGLMAGLMTKVGVYALIRFYTLIFTHDVVLTHSFLLLIAGITMLLGVLGAAAQSDFRKILSFHIVSQIGYMIMGLALYTPLAIAGAIFFIIHNILVKTNLFLISGMVKTTSGYYHLKKLGGVYNRFPLITILFAISAFSLAGIPPLSGFWGKFVLAKAGLQVQAYWVVAASLVAGFLTLYSMSKIWRSAFWSPTPKALENEIRYDSKSFFLKKYMLVIPGILLTMLVIVISFYPDWMIGISMEAAHQLLQPQQYIDAVIDNNK